MNRNVLISYCIINQLFMIENLFDFCRFQVPYFKFQIPGSRLLTLNLEPGTWNLESEINYRTDTGIAFPQE